MYQSDSFFTLSVAGSIGLMVLSIMVALGLLVAGWWMMRGRAWPLRLIIAVVMFIGFVWFSPQVYYSYYLLLIDGLPLQWVIKWPNLGELLGTATFTGPATLSAHSQGLLFWGLVIVALVARDRSA